MSVGGRICYGTLVIVFLGSIWVFALLEIYWAWRYGAMYLELDNEGWRSYAESPLAFSLELAFYILIAVWFPLAAVLIVHAVRSQPPDESPPR